MAQDSPTLGIFSWNIQNNFNNSRFIGENLNKETNKETNTNEFSKKEIIEEFNVSKRLTKHFDNQPNKYPDFLALGFQEVDTPDKEKETKINQFMKDLVSNDESNSHFFKNYELVSYKIKGEDKEKYSISVLDKGIIRKIRDYSIFLFILKKKKISYNIKIIDIHKHNPIFLSKKKFSLPIIKASKGIVGFKLQIYNSDKKLSRILNIYTCHLPFESNVEVNRGFIETLSKRLRKKEKRKDGGLNDFNNSIVFGDLNSRSLIVNDCYVKNSETCDSNDQKKKKKKKKKNSWLL